MSDIWKARLLPGSWRGIPFFIESHELSGGRHAKNHEPPDRDTNSAEDIGKKGKVYRVDAHVIGDNYFFIRDALINAMEDQGRGTLVHPYLGIKEVQPDSYTVRETTGEGRICRISMTFIEAGEPSFPFAAIDAVTDFITSAVAAVAQVKNAFQVAYKIAELPGFAKQSAEALLEDFTYSIENGFKNVRLNGEDHAELTRKSKEIRDNASTLIDNPASMINEIDSVIETLKTLVPDPPDSFTLDVSAGRDDKLAVFNDLLAFEGDNVAGATPIRVQERANSLALSDAIQQLALIRLAEQTVAKDFKSSIDALENRDTVSDNVLIQIAKERTSDEVFGALEDLNAKLIRAVPNVFSTSGAVKEVELLESTPSLVVAYDLYESLDNEKDLIDRNQVRNPAFVNGTIEVLTA